MRIERLIQCSLTVVLSVAAFAATNGNTALVDAVKNQDADSVRALLKQHVDVNVPEADGTTALHWAAHFGDLATVDALLSEGASAIAINRYGATPLSEAVRIGGAPLIEKLLKAGADPNTLVHRAGRDGSHEGIARWQSGRGESSAGTWRGSERQRKFPRPDCLDVGVRRRALRHREAARLAWRGFELAFLRSRYLRCRRWKPARPMRPSRAAA